MPRESFYSDEAEGAQRSALGGKARLCLSCVGAHALQPRLLQLRFPLGLVLRQNPNAEAAEARPQRRGVSGAWAAEEAQSACGAPVGGGIAKQGCKRASAPASNEKIPGRIRPATTSSCKGKEDEKEMCDV